MIIVYSNLHLLAAFSLGVSFRCADLRFDAQRTTKHQIDGCPIFTTIFRFVVSCCSVKCVYYDKLPIDKCSDTSCCAEYAKSKMIMESATPQTSIAVCHSSTAKTFFLPFRGPGKIN